MNNYIFYLLKSKLAINVKGGNIERFIKRLKENNIDILKLDYISKSEINIIILKKDYNMLEKLKTIYEITIINYYGYISYKKTILNNKYIIIFMLFALIFVNFITSMIFSIDILTNDYNMKNKLLAELNDFGIKKYRLKKDYITLQKIKKNILNKYKDELEWIEIESLGTKYIIKFEPRIINNIEEDNTYRNIISKKDAIITNLKISEGEIVKDINSYVKKGDIIVSGNIKFNDNVKANVSATGEVFGEAWYTIKASYPYKYHEEIETGKSKKIFTIYFLNNKIELFNFKKYKFKKIFKKAILKNNLLPIGFNLELQKELKIIDENNSNNEVLDKAIAYSSKKMNELLDKGEYIKEYKVLNTLYGNNFVTLNIFYSVIEKIGEYQSISEINEQITN